jgi:hypothetical protein
VAKRLHLFLKGRIEEVNARIKRTLHNTPSFRVKLHVARVFDIGRVKPSVLMPPKANYRYMKARLAKDICFHPVILQALSR